VTDEDGGLQIVPVFEIAAEVDLFAAGEALCAFGFTNRDVL
jgi:hypothetical protein